MRAPLRLGERKYLLVFVDLILVNAATLVAFWIHARLKGVTFDRNFVGGWWAVFVLLSILWISSAYINGLYDLSATGDFIVGVRSLLLTTFLVVMAYMALFFFSPPKALLRRVVLYQGAVGLVLVGAWRFSYGLLMRHPAFSRKVLIVGAGWAGQTIAQALTQHLEPHYQVVGFVDDDPEKQARMIPVAGAHRHGLDDRAVNEVSFPVLGTREVLETTGMQRCRWITRWPAGSIRFSREGLTSLEQ
jgi:FlaA1/EpsC-like NDP-sugar epimerase